jgi:hypothetical protein
MSVEEEEEEGFGLLLLLLLLLEEEGEEAREAGRKPQTASEAAWATVKRNRCASSVSSNTAGENMIRMTRSCPIEQTGAPTAERRGREGRPSSPS